MDLSIPSNDKLSFSKFERFLIIAALAFECNPTLASVNLGQYTVLGLLFVCLIVRGKGNTIILYRYTECFMLFTGWCALTLIWSISLSTSISNFLMIAKCFFLVLFLANRKFDFKFNLIVYSVINSIDALILMPNIDLNALFTRGSRGHHVVFGVRWSTNLICTMFAFSIFFLFILFTLEKEKKKKILCILFGIPLIIDILLLGSRQALALAAGSVLIYYFIQNRHNSNVKKIVGGAVIILLLVVVFFYIMSNETLYLTIGRRILGSDQSSDSYRLQLIKTGIDFFADHPFLGTGLGSYQTLNNFGAAYSHNNYIELLVSTGFLGFLLYHFMFFFPLTNIISNKRLTNTSRSIVITLVLMSLFAEMVIVTYQVFQYHYLIYIAYFVSLKGTY